MYIREYNIDELAGFIRTDAFKESDIIPITTIRAVSQINNPRAGKNDKILFVAFEENAVAGYIGILPDKMYIENKEIKIGWISCWWTDADKGKSVALELFYKAMEFWPDNIMITDMIPKTKFIIDRTGEFFCPKQFSGLRCFLRFNSSTLLPQKSKFFKKTGFLLSMIDFLFNIINDIRLNYIKIFLDRQLKKTGIRLDYVENIDHEADEFIKNHRENELFCRGREELTWIKSYPWISDSVTSEAEGKKYFFSSYSKLFETRFLKIYRNNEMVGFMMTSRRGADLKIPFQYFDKNNISLIIKVIFSILIINKNSVFTTFNPHMIEYIKTCSTPFYYKRKLVNDLAASVNFRNLNFKNIHLQDGDGDCAFT
jgi:hypothetical protein